MVFLDFYASKRSLITRVADINLLKDHLPIIMTTLCDDHIYDDDDDYDDDGIMYLQVYVSLWNITFDMLA